MIDDDWETTQVLFQYLNVNWGPHTVDRFADNKNAKVSPFNSSFWRPGTEGADAFSFDWSNENILMKIIILLLQSTLSLELFVMSY